MKLLFSPLLLLICFTTVLAQQSPSSYTVKGVVLDSLGQTVIGATVKLSTSKDTVLTGTNIDGVYAFNNIKSPNFKLTFSSLGFATYSKDYNNKPSISQIIIPNVVLAIQTNMLNQVIVDGTPSIQYKTDTTEYKAGNYQVRENATVEDLVKKMEGMEVDKDGGITVQGESVARARINGKDYFGGNVAKALKDLPADVVDKIQIIDDYGDEAAKTGIKDGDPQKVINIVTRQDKKVGNRGRFESGVGSSDRYQLNLSGNRFNGNQQIAVKLGLNNTITGVAGSGGGGSGGTRQTNEADFSYNDNFSKKVKLSSSYNYRSNGINSINNSTVEEYNTIGTIFSIRNGQSNNESLDHNFNAKLEYNPNESNWLTFRPDISYSSSNNLSNSALIQTGAIRQDQESINQNRNTTPSYNLQLNLGHRFNKKGTFVSLNLSTNNSYNDQNRDVINNISYYDTTANSNEVVKDSTLRRQIGVDNISQNYRSSITFSQPLSEKSRLEFNGQINYRGYDNQQITNVLDFNGNLNTIDSLSRIFNYSFTETRLALNYRYRADKYNFSVGLTAVPGLLKGESVNRNNTTRRSSFNIIPILRYEYQWSRQKKLSFRYFGRPQEPSYDQIQDVPDVTNPQNPVVGNPNLKTAFRHLLRFDFNNYIVNSKININARLVAVVNRDQVIRNNVLVQDEFNSLKRETRFLNANGNQNYSGNYDFSKRFAENKYAISYNGNLEYNQSVSQTNSVENIGKTWSWRQRLGLQINPQEWLEIVPNVRYTSSQTDFSLPTSRDNKNSNLALSLEGRTNITKTFFIGYDLSKNFVSGINANVTSNPFIINTFITKEFFARKNGSISLRSYDLLNQNNFVTRRVTENAIIDTQSNALSRYFMFTMSWAPQKWSGGSANSNRDRGSRNGDGSYRN